MELSRIKQLRQSLEDENIDLTELAEIEDAFDKIPDQVLRDERENATAADMLDELEDQVSPLERSIYNWVEENFGESEANDPSWNINSLAQHLEGEGYAVGETNTTQN